MRIDTSRPSTSTTLGGSASQSSVVQPHPLSVLLFGRRPPRWIDPRKSKKQMRALRKLAYLKDQIVELMGEATEDFSIGLCEGSNASISKDGQIAIGVGLLQQQDAKTQDDLLVAVLAHELGHPPKSWPQAELQGLPAWKVFELHRELEAKADRFAGRILADLDASPDAVCEFLLRHQRFESGKLPRDYYPAEMRAQMIRDAYRARQRRLSRRVGMPRLRELR
jgi:hypothetical protein